jgi:hypothetical protein
VPPFNIGAFRSLFPEFSDTVAYPAQTIEFWANLGTLLVLPSIWGNCWVQGMSLYIAHQMVLASQNEKIAQAGGAPGTFGGVANNKTVGGASVGYDSQSTSVKDAGFWNLTNYGKQFFTLVKIFGTRPIQLTGQCGGFWGNR